MGIAYEQLPETGRQWVGEAVCGEAAKDIDKADAVQWVANRRIATILTVSTLLRRGDDTNDPVARSKADETGMHRAGAVEEGRAWS